MRGGRYGTPNLSQQRSPSLHISRNLACEKETPKWKLFGDVFKRHLFTHRDTESPLPICQIPQPTELENDSGRELIGQIRKVLVIRREQKNQPVRRAWSTATDRLRRNRDAGVRASQEFERPKLRVRVTKYPKFVCQHHAECGVQQPPRPKRTLVEGNRFDTSIAAEIIAAKYAFHMPTYRQQDWFGGSGWMPDRSTLLNILASAAYVLEPLYHHYAAQVRTSPVIPTDETNVMLLLPPEIHGE